MVVALWAPAAGAGEPVDAARELAREGLALFQEGRFEAAYDKFAEANQLRRAPTLLLFMARCEREVGRLLEAQKLYQAVVDEPLGPDASPPFVEAQETAGPELEELRDRIPSVRIAVGGPPLSTTEVRVDGELVDSSLLDDPVPLNPGRHVLTASAPGFVSASHELELVEDGSVMPVQLDLEPEPGGEGAEAIAAGTEGAPGPLWPSIVAFGVGGAALGVGAVTGGIALSQTADIRSRCTHNICPPEELDKRDEARTMATVSTASFIAGGVLAAAGVVLFILRPGGEEGESAQAVQVEPWLGPGMAGLRGSF